MDEKALTDPVSEERERFYLFHLLICKASETLAHDRPVSISVPKKIMAEAPSAAYGRREHPDYWERALVFIGLKSDQTGPIFARPGKFMEEFYPSRLFRFLISVMGEQPIKIANLVSTKVEEHTMAVSSAAISGTISIYTWSVQTTWKGNLATFWLRALSEFGNGSLLAPSEGTLSAYMAGKISWESHGRRYLAEMREFFRASPEKFGNILQKNESHWSVIRATRTGVTRGSLQSFWKKPQRSRVFRLFLIAWQSLWF